MLDFIIWLLTSFRDWLAARDTPLSILPPPAADSSLVIPYFNYEVQLPGFLKSVRVSRTTFTALAVMFLIGMLLRIRSVLQRRREFRTSQIKYGDSTPRGSPTARPALAIMSPGDLLTSTAMSRVKDGGEQLCQDPKGARFVAVRNGGFLEVWEADEDGRAMRHKAPENELFAEVHCEQLLRHFSDREVSSSFAESERQNSSSFLTPETKEGQKTKK